MRHMTVGGGEEMGGGAGAVTGEARSEQVAAVTLHPVPPLPQPPVRLLPPLPPVSPRHDAAARPEAG
eukprot:2299042-Rhodomonas_salina.1